MQTCDHQRRGVSAQALPQQTSQLTVTVRNVIVSDVLSVVRADTPLSQSCDHFSESEQTLIDLDGLFLGEPLCLYETLALGAGQIDDLQLANDCVVRVARKDLLHCDAEDGVRARRGHIHSMTAHGLILDTVVVQVQDFIDTLAFNIHQVFHRVDIVLVPLELEALITPHVVEQKLALFLRLKHVSVE